MAKAEWHREEANRIHAIAEKIADVVQEANQALDATSTIAIATLKPRFAIPAPRAIPAASTPKIGRPKKQEAVNTLVSHFLDTVDDETEFTTEDIKDYARSYPSGIAGYDIPSNAFFDALKEAIRGSIADGYMRVLVQPRGKRAGLYTRTPDQP